MHLLVTRPREDASQLTDDLVARGHQVTVEPLLTIEPAAGAAIAGDHYQAILVTSANGVRALERLAQAADLKEVPVLAVGRASAEASMAAGFKDVKHADGDLADLTRLVCESCTASGGSLLYAAGRKVSGDLKGLLEREGFGVERAVLYDAVEARELSRRTVEALANVSLDGVLLYSPRTARIWARLAPRADILHFCLSQAVADALGDVPGARLVASRPNQDALLSLVEDTALKPRTR